MAGIVPAIHVFQDDAT